MKNTKTARFSQCFLPVVTAIPAILGALILLTYAFRLFNAYRPSWTKPFIEETKESPDDLVPEPAPRPLFPTYGLLVVCMVGLVLQIVTIFFPFRDLMEIYPSIAWVRCLKSPALFASPNEGLRELRLL